MLHDLYNGDIPEDMIKQAWDQSAKDNLVQRQMRSARDDAASDAQKAKRLADVANTKANYTTDKRQEQSEKLAVYHDNMMEQMNEEDYADYRARNNAAQKRYRDKKRTEKNGSSATALQPKPPLRRPRLSRGSNTPQILSVARPAPSRHSSCGPQMVTTTTPKIMHLSENEVESPPRKRQLRSSTMNRKQAMIIQSSDSESDKEQSDTESLGGFIVDDDCEE
jgi:hypothetical protein